MQYMKKKKKQTQTNKQNTVLFLFLKMENHFSGSWEGCAMHAYAIISTIRSILLFVQ